MASRAPVVVLSAAGDLKDWRDHLQQAFERSGFTVRTQDRSLESAAGDTRRLLVEAIAEADCVIHLAGTGYGAHAVEPFPEAPVRPGDPPFRCSWTQFEYYHAHQARKDVIALVCASELSKPGFVEEGENEADRLLKHRLQEEHRHRVASGRFAGTPLEGVADRTFNESVSSAGKLMEAVAAAVGTLHRVDQEHVRRAGQELRGLATRLSQLQKRQRWLGRVLLAGAVLLVVIGVAIFSIKREADSTAKVVEVVEQKQDQQTALITDQRMLLKEAVAQLEILTRDKAQLGVKIQDLPREAIYQEIAARLNVPEAELVTEIEAGKKSHDALTRARAHLLARGYDDAHLAAREAREADRAAIERVKHSHEIDAESYLHEVRYENALESRQKAAALADKNADSRAWADAQEMVAVLQLQLARYKDAEPLLREVAIIREKGGEPDRPKLATALNNLAQLLKATNRLQEAEPLMRRTLEMDEAAFGARDAQVAIRLGNLGKRLSEAEPLLRRALAIDEASLGKDHVDVALDLNNLALLLRATDRLKDAEPLSRRHLEIFVKFKQTTGHAHPYYRDALASYRSILQALKLSKAQVAEKLRGLEEAGAGK